MTDTVIAQLSQFIMLTMRVQHEFDADTPFAQLGLDSLDLIELVVEAERVLGRSIPNEALGEIKTLRQLIAAGASPSPT